MTTYTRKIQPQPVEPGERRFYLMGDGQVVVRSLVAGDADHIVTAIIPPPEGSTEVSEERGLELQAAALAAGADAQAERAAAVMARKVSDAQAFVAAGVPEDVAERFAGIVRRPG